MILWITNELWGAVNIAVHEVRPAFDAVGLYDGIRHRNVEIGAGVALLAAAASGGLWWLGMNSEKEEGETP